MQWSDKDCDTLRRLWGTCSASTIVASFDGKYSRNAIIGKAHRLELVKIGQGRHPLVENHKAPRKAASQKQIVIRKSIELAPTLPTPSPPFDGKPVTIIELTNETCRWPVTDDPTAMLYCGKPEASLKDERPYCIKHHTISYQTR